MTEEDGGGVVAASSDIQHALYSRVTIEQAKGILAEQGELSVSEAFKRLRKHARATSTQASEVANLAPGACCRSTTFADWAVRAGRCR